MWSKETTEMTTPLVGRWDLKLGMLPVSKKERTARGIRKSPEERERETDWTQPGLEKQK